MKIRVIVNPKAGAGAAGRKVSEIRRALSSRSADFDLVETSGPGNATALARAAQSDGVDVLAVVGGDGTLNEVSQAFLDGDRPVPGPSLALIPAGTGGDFGRAIRAGGTVEAAVQRIVEGKERPLDLGVVEVASERGEPVRRAFVNIASFGVSGRIDRLVNSGPKWMGGRAAFAIGTVRAMATYRNAPVSIRVDGKPWYEGRLVVGAIANGQYFGGGMRVAPKADTGDGLLDVVVLGDLTFAESCGLAPKVYAGKHLASPRVESTRGVEVEALPLGGTPVYVDTDGETPGQLPLRAKVFPGALRLRS